MDMQNQCQAMCADGTCQCDRAPNVIRDTDFDISRTFSVLTAALVLPLMLALSVVSYSVNGLL